MNELFGISMTTIMWVMLALFALSVAGVALIWLGNRTMFRLGLRNVPRRGSQTVLVVLGLMLSTLIITASFTTGDTIDYSFTKSAYDTLGRTDLRLNVGGASGGEGGSVSQDLVPTLERQFQGDADIEGFLPFLREPLPALNGRTRLAEPNVTLVGVDVARLSALGGLRQTNGQPADLSALDDQGAFVSKTAADKLDVLVGDQLTIYAQDRPWTVTVLGIVDDTLASGATPQADTPDAAGGVAVRLATAQAITGQSGRVNWISVALRGGVRESLPRTDAAKGRLEAFLQSDPGKQAVALGERTIQVEPLKQDSVKQAQTFGNLFTTFFLVMGLFSIAAGIMLIFMIFVMLAAERKGEMGMARAVGARRSQLIQMFVSEGMAYNVMAGAVGAILGVGAAFALVVIGLRIVLGNEANFLTAHVTPRSLVISYCLGAVLTFITVLISSMRVSRLNIVAAVRGTDDIKGREPRRRTHWGWVLAGIPALVIPPLGWYWLARKGFGLPHAWVWGPLGIVSGLALMALGTSTGKLFPFALGISLLPLAGAALARWLGAPSRATWTMVGALLALYWLTPGSWLERVFGKLDGNVEMFVLSGIMIVIGFTLLIAFNARLLTVLFGRGDKGYLVGGLLVALALLAGAAGWALGDTGDGLGQLLYLLGVLLLLAGLLSLAATRFPRLAPALTMGVAYPLANRFRTGMTIAMFSLIVFSLVVMSTMTANFGAIFAGDDARGGWDLVAETNPINPVPDLIDALRAEGSFDTGRIATVGRATSALSALQSRAGSEVRQVGQAPDWKPYPVRAGDAAFFSESETALDMRATGYASDRAVFAAVGTQPNLAIMDALPVQQDGGFGGGELWRVAGLKPGQQEFEPFQVELRDPTSGRTTTVTIIGVLSAKIPIRVMPGIFTNEATYTPVFGQPQYGTSYLRLAPGQNDARAAKDIKAALSTKGVQTTAIGAEIDRSQAQSKGFFRIFQLFMGLGLFVGVAALGVIAFRSVVERRQQIGMLRAIGYQRGTVALTFLFESSFIALMGILSGVVGAAILARNLLTSDEFSGTSVGGVSFFIPWGEIATFVLAAYLFSLLLTWWPSRGAARVPIAEALRYE